MLVPQALQAGFVAATNAVLGPTLPLEDEVSPIGSFTDPEYAQVGLTEQKARETHDVVTAVVPFDFAVRAPMAREDLPGLCERVCGLLEESRCGLARCDVGGVEPDAVTVDALARLQLAARRHGCRVQLRNASAALLELVDFMGLREVLPE